MKCHYEVLNLARDADEPEIKTAYKKLALKWHPDKNLDNTDEATEQFQLVQQAYEVLIDKQERAWYDNHREQILRGSNSEYEDNSLNVFQYFTTTCFKGYGDDEKGFYAVYREVFDQLIKEDIEYMDEREELDEMPTFGDSASDYDDVVGPFYNYWMSYSTRKSYVWLDPYDIKETRDRRVLKLIEKENKKVRLKAKKERNDEVRNLVGFVRKRDKRVQANTKRLEARIVENRKKQEEISKQKRIQRAQELNASGHQAEWTKFDNVKSELEQIEKHLAEQFGEEFSNSEDDDDDNLYCVACNKMFKTPKAFQNHESSKRHRENVEVLKQTMLEEEANVSEVDDDISDDVEDDETLSSADEGQACSNREVSNDGVTTKTAVNGLTVVDGITDIDGLIDEDVNAVVEPDINAGTTKKDPSISDSDSEARREKRQKKKNRKSKNVLRAKTTSETDNTSDGETLRKKLLENDSDGNDFGSTKKQKKKNKKNGKVKQSKEPGSKLSPEQDVCLENMRSEENVRCEKNVGSDENLLNPKETRLDSPEDPQGNNSNTAENPKEKLENLDKDRQASKKPEPKSKSDENRNKSKTKKNKKQLARVDIEDLDTDHFCAACKANFPSKNKLFEHLKTTGHSVYLPQNDKQPVKSKKKLREK